MKKKEYTKEVLLDVMGSYLRQINRSGKEYPTIVLSDLQASIKSVLKENNYDGKYQNELNK